MDGREGGIEGFFGFWPELFPLFDGGCCIFTLIGSNEFESLLFMLLLFGILLLLFIFGLSNIIFDDFGLSLA